MFFSLIDVEEIGLQTHDRIHLPITNYDKTSSTLSKHQALTHLIIFLIERSPISNSYLEKQNS